MSLTKGEKPTYTECWFTDNSAKGMGRTVQSFDGEVYVGEHLDDHYHGHGVETYASGNHYEGQLRNS